MTENHHVESSLVVIKIVCKQIYYKISIWKNLVLNRYETFFLTETKKNQTFAKLKKKKNANGYAYLFSSTEIFWKAWVKWENLILTYSWRDFTEISCIHRRK